MAAGPTLGPMPEGRPTPGPDGLVGGEGAQPQVTDQETQNRDFAKRVRMIHEDLENFARQYPDMGPVARKMQEALKEGMVKHLSQGQRPAESAGAQSLVG